MLNEAMVVDVLSSGTSEAIRFEILLNNHAPLYAGNLLKLPIVAGVPYVCWYANDLHDKPAKLFNVAVK